MVHGWGCTSLDYLPLLDVLVSANPETMYIAPDLPGHGESPTSICPRPSVSAFAELLNRLCHEVCTAQNDAAQGEESTEELAEKLSGTSSFPASSDIIPGSIERIIIGHSMGCRIVLEVFAQEPGHVSGIVLLDGSRYGRNVNVAKRVETSLDNERKIILEAVHGMFGPATPSQFKEQVAKRLQEIDLAYANQLSRDFVAWDQERMEDVLWMVRENKCEGGSVTVVLVIQATEGRGSTRRTLRRGEETAWMKFVRNVLGALYTGLVVEGSGHWPHIDKAGEVAQAIKDFEDRC